MINEVKSIRNSSKEFVLNYYIGRNKTIIENIINRKIDSVELEKNFTNNRKIDIFCKCKDFDTTSI